MPEAEEGEGGAGEEVAGESSHLYFLCLEWRVKGGVFIRVLVVEDIMHAR